MSNEKLARPTPYHTATAIKDPAHLKRWLLETGRAWVVLKTGDLIDALPWPAGVDALMQIIEAYRQHRAGVPVEYAACPKLKLSGHGKNSVCDICTNRNQIVTRSKTDVLELDEMKEAAVWLVNQIRERDSLWNPFITQ